MFYTEVQKTNNRSLEYGNEHGMALTRENREKRKKEKKNITFTVNQFHPSNLY